MSLGEQKSHVDKKGKARLILACSTNTNCEMAYPSFRSENGSTRGISTDTNCENMAYRSVRSENGSVNGVSCQSLSSLSPVSLSGAFWGAAASTLPLLMLLIVCLICLVNLRELLAVGVSHF